MEDPIIAEEVEYNFGRAFQSIGVVHLAARHYEKVLAMVDERMKEYEEIEDRDVSSVVGGTDREDSLTIADDSE